MNNEWITGFTSLGIAMTIIIAAVLLTLFCVMIKTIVEDMISRRRLRKRAMKAINCDGYIYQSLTPQRPTCTMI